MRPGSPLRLHGTQADITAALDRPEFKIDAITASPQFRLGAEQGVFVGSGAFGRTPSAFNLDSGMDAAERTAALTRLEDALDTAVADIDAARASGNASLLASAQDNARGLAEGDLSPAHFDQLKAGGAVVEVGRTRYYSSDIAEDALLVARIEGDPSLLDRFTSSQFAQIVTDSKVLAAAGIAGDVFGLAFTVAEINDHLANGRRNEAEDVIATFAVGLGGGLMGTAAAVGTALALFPELGSTVAGAAVLLGIAVLGGTAGGAVAEAPAQTFVDELQTRIANGESLLVDDIIAIRDLHFRDAGVDPDDVEVVAVDGRLMAVEHCFAPTTPITMWDGTVRPIEAVAAGDRVLSFDAEGRAAPGTVTRLFRNPTREWVELTFADGRDPITVTPGHRFLAEAGHYQTIGSMLASGGGRARVVLADGAMAEVVGRSVAWSSETAEAYEAARVGSGAAMADGNRMAVLSDDAEPAWQTYNFEVAHHHNDVAGGVRVHNDSILRFLSPAEKAALVDLRADDSGTPAFAVVKLPGGGNSEIEYTLGGGGTTAVAELTTSDGAGNLIYQRSVRGPDGEVFEVARPLIGQPGGGAVAASLTPFLTTAFLGEDANPFEAIVADTVMRTVLFNLGEVIGGTIHRGIVDVRQMNLGVQIDTAMRVSFEDFGGELVLSGAGAVISTVNQLIMAEVFEVTGADGVEGAVLDAVLGTGINAVLGNGVQWLFEQDATQQLLVSSGLSKESLARCRRAGGGDLRLA